MGVRIPPGLPMKIPKSFWIKAILQILVHPSIWRSALRFVPTRRGSKGSFSSYIHFRLTTMYGASESQVKDIIPYLKWCKEFNRTARKRQREFERRTSMF